MLTVKRSYEPLSKLFPSVNVANVGAALIAGGIFPMSHKRGKCPEVMCSTHMADGIIALSLNEPLRNIAGATRIYSALRNSDNERAGDILSDHLDLFRLAKREISDGVKDSQTLRNAARALNTCVTINCNFPLITISRDGAENVVFGPIRDRQSTYVRAVKSTTISGRVLLEISNILFGDS